MRKETYEQQKFEKREREREREGNDLITLAK